MKSRSKSCLALCACLALGPLSAALADEKPSAPPNGSAATPDPYPPAEDILLGNGSRGPYLLGWNHLLFGSEAIEVDGRRVQQGLDYSLDYATGSLQFFRPLAQGQAARVRYRCDGAQARPNAGGPRLPVALKLWQGSGGSLQVGGLMTPAAGVRQYNLDLNYGPSQRFSFRSKVERVDALAEAQRGHSRTLESHQLALAPAAGSRLTLSRDVTGKMRPDGVRDQTATTRAQLEQRLGGATSATASVERSEGTGAPGGTTSDRTAFTLTTRPSPRAQIVGGYAKSNSAQAGAEATSNLSLATTPWDRWKLTSQFTRRDSQVSGASSTMGFDWAGKTGKWFGLEGGITRRDSEKVGTEDAQRVRLSLGPLSLEGRRRESDRLTSPDDAEESLRLEASMVRGVRLGGSRGSRITGADATDLSEAFVEIAPIKSFQMRGSLQSSVTGEQEAQTTALSAALKAPGVLELSGAYKSREATSQDALISRDYAIALTPLKGLKLQGAYRENPEDNTGRVLDQQQTSLGLQSQLGSLGLSGTYTNIATGLAASAATTEQMELKLTLDLAPRTRFYSGYRDRETRQNALLRDRTFSLGFSRSVGSGLFLLLEGEYTLSDRDGQPADDPSDTRANARLGLRF